MVSERRMDQILHKSIMIGRIQWKVVDGLYMVCLLVLAFLIRWELMPIESADYYGFLKGWMEEIRNTGGFLSLDHSISNYTSPYMYLMCLVSYLPTNDLYALKLISIFFDYVAALAIFLLIYEWTNHLRKSMIGMSVLLLCPTVILDSAYWCQCDMIYSAFILLALVAFAKGKSRRCMIWIGIAFSFKLQALFIVPFLVLMWLMKKTIQLRHFVYVPIIYVLSAVPAWLFGRNFKELLGIYFEQSSYYPWGTLEYPNVYALLGETMPDMHHAQEVSGAGTFMLIMMMGVLAYYLYSKKITFTNEMTISLALFTVALCVYTLPHMHDRYGFLIDLLAIVYGILNGKKLMVTCGFVLISILTYMPYLIARHIVPIQYLAIGLLALIVWVGRDLYQQIKVQESSL